MPEWNTSPLVSALPSTLIIGGGIAGLAAAWSLRRVDPRPIALLEAEPLTFSHSSARNAAIYRPLEAHPSTTSLAARSLPLLEELETDEPLLQRVGLVLAATRQSALAQLRTTAAATGTSVQTVEGERLESLAPSLRGGAAQRALVLPAGGILDVHGVGEQLRKRTIAAGVGVWTGRRAMALEAAGDRIVGVRLDDGQRIGCERVVIAAGAWSRELGASVGCPLPLVPHRRHLAILAAAERPGSDEPVCWSVDMGVYFRREGEGILACPGDHEPHPAGIPHVAPRVLESLAVRLPGFSPRLKDARLIRAWACLRTMTPDGQAVVGADPRLDGLFWITGLGGFGMSGGLGAGQLLSQAIVGVPDPLLPVLSPERLLGRAGAWQSAANAPQAAVRAATASQLPKPSDAPSLGPTGRSTDIG